mgnify:CR=1 FL=1
MLRCLLLALLQPWLCAGRESYQQQGLRRAKANAPNSELLQLFRAAVALDDIGETGVEEWNNLGIALMNAAGEDASAAPRRS